MPLWALRGRRPARRCRRWAPRWPEQSSAGRRFGFADGAALRGSVDFANVDRPPAAVAGDVDIEAPARRTSVGEFVMEPGATAIADLQWSVGRVRGCGVTPWKGPLHSACRGACVDSRPDAQADRCCKYQSRAAAAVTSWSRT